MCEYVIFHSKYLVIVFAIEYGKTVSGLQVLFINGSLLLCATMDNDWPINNCGKVH